MPLGKSTHIEIREVDAWRFDPCSLCWTSGNVRGDWRVSAGYHENWRQVLVACVAVLHARTDRDVYVSLCPCLVLNLHSWNLSIRSFQLSSHGKLGLHHIGHRAVVLRALHSAHGSACQHREV